MKWESLWTCHRTVFCVKVDTDARIGFVVATKSKHYGLARSNKMVFVRQRLIDNLPLGERLGTLL